MRLPGADEGVKLTGGFLNALAIACVVAAALGDIAALTSRVTIGLAGVALHIAAVIYVTVFYGDAE